MGNDKQPMQPVINVKGVHRFKENKLVSYLLDNGGIDMNHLSTVGDLFTQEDKEQFAQLIGYSVCGFGELSYVSDKAYNKAMKRSEKLK
jgi:hypothetical protein